MTLAILIHALVFLLFWLTNLPFQKTLNDFLAGASGLRANFLLIFMLFAGLVGLWSALRLALRRKPRRAAPAWLYLGVGIFFLVLFYASFMVLFLKNPVQLQRLGQMVQYFRLFVDGVLLLLLAWLLPRRVRLTGVRTKALLPAALFVLWLAPVIWTPGNVYRGLVPAKPLLIAHRGASTLAPENTLASMQAAADLGIYGVETDISASFDGVLFLMHDASPARTTDAAQVFPGREDDPAETFTWDELSRLNAGSWFGGQAAYSGERIPSLSALLQLVRENDLHLIYDLRIPSPGHPYAGRALELCLEEIRAAGVEGQTWVLAEAKDLERVRTVLPGATLAAGIGYTQKAPSPETLAAQGYRVVNSAYGLPVRRIQAYRAAGLWVNLWVVDEPWQYARLWLAGADSVTSNVPQTLLGMPSPLLALPYGVYLVLWALVGLLAAGVYVWAARRKTM